MDPSCDIFIALCWAVFLVVVIAMSRRVGKEKPLRYDRGGSLSMTLQYTIFFTILVHSYIYRFERFSEVVVVVGLAVLVLGLGAYFLTLRGFAASYNPMVSIRESQTLVTRGPYRYIRHPLYAFQMVAMIGTGLAIQHPAYLALPAAFYAMYRTSRREEELLTEFFDDYAAYRRRTRIFIPFLL